MFDKFFSKQTNVNTIIHIIFCILRKLKSLFRVVVIFSESKTKKIHIFRSTKEMCICFCIGFATFFTSHYIVNKKSEVTHFLCGTSTHNDMKKNCVFAIYKLKYKQRSEHEVHSQVNGAQQKHDKFLKVFFSC